MNELQAVNVLKGLVIDGVDKAKSGHPGGAMSSMDFAYLLFREYLRFDPNNPQWQGRDRFVLSAGHESMLIYSLLHSVGWLPMEELKNFRQLHSKTPGHPENYLTPGVECTTGPLGQGAAMSVGFAIAARHQAAALDTELFGHRTWALLGDGCMQEDVTLGAASLAGHLQLGNLIWYYDRNAVQISGKISRTASDNYQQVFEGMNWDVIEVDGHDHSALRRVLDGTERPGSRPLLIIGQSTMAKGAHSLEGSEKTHGSPLSVDERKKTREKLGLPADEAFYAPAEFYANFRQYFAHKSKRVADWQQHFQKKLSDANFKKLYQAYYEQSSWENLPQVEWPRDKEVPTRNAFGDVILKWAAAIPNLIGGSADLEPSNCLEGFAHLVGDFSAEQPQNRNIAFGVREFPMSAIANGLALHGGMIPFDATFLSFADYSRPALRLGAIQQVRVIHEFTHDSFHLGEDGPTHQPVEHMMSLRLIPNFYLMRPADAYETQVMMQLALNLKSTPSAICLSRQKLPLLPISPEVLAQARHGAYAIIDSPNPDLLIFATGAEVALALDAIKLLAGYSIKLVSMPCWELFDQQTSAYKDKVLSLACKKRVSIEAGSTLGWQKYTGLDGLNIGLDRYGDSAPAPDLAKEYGFTPEQVAERIKAYLARA